MAQTNHIHPEVLSALKRLSEAGYRIVHKDQLEEAKKKESFVSTDEAFQQWLAVKSYKKSDLTDPKKTKEIFLAWGDHIKDRYYNFMTS